MLGDGLTGAGDAGHTQAYLDLCHDLVDVLLLVLQVPVPAPQGVGRSAGVPVSLHRVVVLVALFAGTVVTVFFLVVGLQDGGHILRDGQLAIRVVLATFSPVTMGVQARPGRPVHCILAPVSVHRMRAVGQVHLPIAVHALQVAFVLRAVADVVGDALLLLREALIIVVLLRGVVHVVGTGVPIGAVVVALLLLGRGALWPQGDQLQALGHIVLQGQLHVLALGLLVVGDRTRPCPVVQHAAPRALTLLVGHGRRFRWAMVDSSGGAWRALTQPSFPRGSHCVEEHWQGQSQNPTKPGHVWGHSTATAPPTTFSHSTVKNDS
ncbi:uncharacterized protein LOC124907532 [Homo sapiens]|uniref:uncharacterized protein LOC124907532 n=1 Tax=Homo sapiens TaxID=9606 RepID=UPI001FB0952E|nr:uncharacterized protein LOC124907532 [Homo sapiens]